MTFKEVQAKLVSGEALTDAERDFLKGYDPDKVSNDAAAAARRKAEKDAADARAEVEAYKAEKAERDARAAEEAGKGQTEAQKQAKAFEAMQKEVAAIKKERDEAKQVSAQMARKQALAEIRQANGIQFTDKVRQSVAVGAFEETFGDLQDLSDLALVTERVAKFKTENPALVVDTSGHGTGASGQAAAGAGSKKELSLVERQKAMRESGLLK